MANRYLVPGGDGDYDSTTNWSTTSGGASGASFPLTGDDVIIDANSLNAPLNINVVSACRSFVCSAYTGIVSMLSNLTVTGSSITGHITLSPGMTISGVGTFAKSQPSGGASIITSNGVIFDCPFSFITAGLGFVTITGNMEVMNNLTFPTSTTTNITINLGTIKVHGDVIHNCPVNGTANIELVGLTSATITQVPTRYLSTNLTINKGAGAWNQVDLYWGNSAKTLTYTSGIVNHTGILFAASSCFLNTNGMFWNTIRCVSFLSFTSICFANKIEQAAGINITFSGTFGFNVNEFNMVGSNGGFITIASGKTYTINNSIIATSATTNLIFIRCTSGANAIIQLKENAYMKLIRVNFQRITASNKTLRGVRSTVDSFSKNVFNLSSNLNPYSTTK